MSKLGYVVGFEIVLVHMCSISVSLSMAADHVVIAGFGCRLEEAGNHCCEKMLTSHLAFPSTISIIFLSF